jgi:Zinc finger, C3HC4 type (RING finger)
VLAVTDYCAALGIFCSTCRLTVYTACTASLCMSSHSTYFQRAASTVVASPRAAVSAVPYDSKPGGISAADVEAQVAAHSSVSYPINEVCNETRISALDSSTKTLSDSSRLSRADKLCYVCVAREANAVLLECGHGGVCYDCALGLVQQRRERSCPICRVSAV